MVDKEDNFNEFLKQKVDESHFEFNEAYWLKAEKLIENSQPKRKPFWWGFGLGVISLAIIGAGTATVWDHYADRSFVNNNAEPVALNLVNQVHAAPTKTSSNTGHGSTAAFSEEKNNPVAVTTSLKNLASNTDLPSVAAGNKHTTTKTTASDNNVSNGSKKTSEGNFSQVKSLTIPKLPESTVKDTDEETEGSEVVITIAEPFVMNLRNSSNKDIDVNVVAACENQNKHEWMFNLLAGVSDSRGFEGNTISNSRIGFGYFGGMRLAYKLNKNWFTGIQPLIYSRGAINTSVQTEKTAYDFGANPDEFIVKNKALLFAELPLSIGYRIHRHQISVGAGIEYLLNVKSDVKEFGTSNYTPNQWGYTDGFNRFGTMAIFNYAFNVYNEFWLTMMVQKGFTDMTKEDYFTTNSRDKNFNLRIGVQYLFNNQKKPGQ